MKYIQITNKFVKNLALEIDEKVKRIYWTNKEIDKWFGKRSAKEIIKSGNTFFMNPCLDLTLVSSFILKQRNIAHNWVIEEHYPTKEFNFNRLHFVLEINNNSKPLVLNYKGLNEVYIYEGRYNGRQDLQSKQIIRIPSNKLNLNKSFYKNIKESDLLSFLQDYSFEQQLNRLKKDNSIENFKKFEQINKKGFVFKSQ